MYQATFDGKQHELGTSGFLYRSNKLMYDHATKSLWSTLQGQPVVGPLVGQGIRLTRRHVVTTTWGEWKSEHPDTTVLSINTGHNRDYSEGAAYRKYFSTQRLMFDIPQTDQRLRNKDEVLTLRHGDSQLAISVAYLQRNRVFNGRLGERAFVVLTSPSGANRVFESRELRFTSFSGGVVKDSDGKEWIISEESLNASGSTESLERLPAHRAFWFGWFAQFPDTHLIK